MASEKVKKPSEKRVRGYTFVFSHYTVLDEVHIQDLITTYSAYGMYRKIKDVKTGKYRLEGMIEYKESWPISHIIKRLPNADISVRQYAARETADTYRKADLIWEYGTLPKSPGHRDGSILDGEEARVIYRGEVVPYREVLTTNEEFKSMQNIESALISRGQLIAEATMLEEALEIIMTLSRFREDCIDEDMTSQQLTTACIECAEKAGSIMDELRDYIWNKKLKISSR